MTPTKEEIEAQRAEVDRRLDIYGEGIRMFGTDAQILKLEEEALELAFALQRLRLGKGGHTEVFSETADVFILTMQLLMDPEVGLAIDREIAFKTGRLELMMENLQDAHRNEQEAAEHARTKDDADRQ